MKTLLQLVRSSLGRKYLMAATGLMLANPPWTLADEMTALLPELSACLARGETARWRADWLCGP